MSRECELCVAATAAVLALGGIAIADTICVPDDHDTIQEAIDAASDADEICVAPGIYNETIDFLGKAVRLYSTDGAEATVIDAQQAGSVVTCETGEGPGTILDGFTITGGTGREDQKQALAGGGMFNYFSSPSVLNCVFRQNSVAGGGMGGGMVNDHSHPIVSGCTFSENEAVTGVGGGMANRNDSNPIVVNCVFDRNSSLLGGGGVLNGSGSAPRVINCTFLDNEAGLGGGIHSDPSTIPVVANCVFWGNDNGQISGPAEVTYSNIQGGYGGFGNIDADPMFVDPAAGDYRLLAGSPCIDAGANNAVPADALDLDEDGDTNERLPLDLDGNRRFVADDLKPNPGCGMLVVVDMGAYENQQPREQFHPILIGDVDGEGHVTFSDLLAVLSAWGECNAECCLADVDFDWQVGFADLLLVLVNWFEPIATQTIEGYTDRTSYAPGDTLQLHVSTTSPTFDLEIVRVEMPWWIDEPVIALVEDIPGSFHSRPPQAWEGALWPVSHEMTVGALWPTGSYLARMITEDGNASYYPFYVRPNALGSQSRIAYVAMFNTAGAYNEWGGRSFYTKPRGYKLSMLRPHDFSSGRGRTNWNRRMHCHLEELGFELEYITEWDVEQDPEILRHYDIVILAGHHEYVSTRFYDALQDHHDRGGHLALFSANGIYWQLRYEDAGQTIVCYKGYSTTDDPYYGVIDCLVTVRYGSDPLHRPAEALRGIQTDLRSFFFLAEDYVMMAESHWIFDGTGVQNGESFGDLMSIGEQDTILPDSPDVLILLHGHRDQPHPDNPPPPQIMFVDMYATFYADTEEFGFPNGNGGMVFAAGTVAGWIRGLNNGPTSSIVRLATSNLIQGMLDNPPPGSGGGPVPAYCEPCFADLDRDGIVGVSDLVMLLSLWGACPSDGCFLEDLDGSGDIGVADLLILLLSWGPCE